MVQGRVDGFLQGWDVVIAGFCDIPNIRFRLVSDLCSSLDGITWNIPIIFNYLMLISGKK